MIASTVGVAVLSGLLAGCTTTITTAARLQLTSARVRASQSAVTVTPAATSDSVRVADVRLLRSGGRVAYVIAVRNGSLRSQSDLPISVGWLSHGHRVDANGGTGGTYFDAHLPAIPAGGTLRWVFTGARVPPQGAHPFALVGAAPDPGVLVGSLPRLTAVAIRPRGSAPTRTDGVLVRVRNDSGVPQYGLPVYAYLTRAGRVSAAGAAFVSSLAPGASQIVSVPVIGTRAAGRASAAAPATIFR